MKKTTICGHAVWQRQDGLWVTWITDETGKRKQVARKSRRKLEALLCEKYLEDDKKKTRKTATMESLYDDWAEAKCLYVSASTIKRDRTTWNQLYQNEPIIKRPIALITHDELETWMIKTVKKHNMNRHQYSNFSSVARQILDYAVEQEIIDHSPAGSAIIRKDKLQRLLRPEVKGNSADEVFSPDERKKLIDHALKQYEEKRDTVQVFTPLAIAFLLYVPLRRGELVALTFSDIKGHQIILRDSYSHDTKALKGRLKDAAGWRRMDVVPPAMDIINRIKKARKTRNMDVRGPIFTVNENYASLYSALGKTINKYCDELKIPRRSLHKTRKTCASLMHAAGVDDLIIQAQLGHKDIKTTHNSYCYDTKTDVERYEKITKSLS